MSRRSCALLAWVCLVWRAQCDSERFPLSGGVSNGVTVTIKAAKVDGTSTLRFKSPDGKSLFEFTVDTVNREVRRDGDWGETPVEAQTWGGWNLDVDNPISFQFAKTAKTWAISVNDVRQPWFDFVHPVGLVTHVDVDSTFILAEVIQSRPECSTACHASWCSMKPPPESEFYSVNSRECSTSRVTGMGSPQADTWCCDGYPKPINLGSGVVKAEDWIQFHDDASYLQNVCQKFGFEECGAMQGQKAMVVESIQAKGYMRVFNPSLVRSGMSKETPFDSIPASAIVNIPLLAMMKSPGAQRKLVHLDKPQSNGFMFDVLSGLLYYVTSRDVVDGLKRGDFVDMVGMVFNKTSGKLRWFPFGVSAMGHTQYLQSPYENATLLVSDEWLGGHETDPCEDNEKWRDDKDNSCADYATKAYCTFQGATPKLCSDYSLPDPCALYQACQDVQPAIYDASYECCSCGGGIRAPPPEWSGRDDSLLFA